jgi:DNA-binding transcriptional MerR regulator
MKDKFKTLAEVARQLNVAPHRIVYLLTSSKVEEPKTRLGNRRAFSPEDVSAIQKALKKETHE